MQKDQWDEVGHLLGKKLVDNEGQRVGKVEGVGSTSATLEPTWLIVKTSHFGRERVIPVRSVIRQGDVIQVPFSKQMVLNAPQPMTPQSLGLLEEEELTHYYESAA